MSDPIKIAVCVVALFAILVLARFVYLKIRHYKHTRCPNCKARYNYKRDVYPQVKATRIINGKALYRVEYECFCRRCGKERSYYSYVRSHHRR